MLLLCLYKFTMSEKRNILVIDDSRKFALQLQVMLFTNGSTGLVEVATTLSEAREALERRQTHIIVSDIRLAEGDTLGLLKAVKAREPQIKLIVLSAVFDALHKQLCRAAGVDYVIDKAAAFQEIPKALAANDRNTPPVDKKPL